MKSPRYPRMRNFKSPIFLAALYFLLNTGCKKSDTQQFTPGFNIYMAGTVNNAAVFWKNGQGTELAPYSGATCIAVAGTDIFVGGMLNSVPVYWKNGQSNSLGLSAASVTGIALSGSDVYLSGAGQGNPFIDSTGDIMVNGNTAGYWKNGVFNILENTPRVSAAEGICFSGSDMYVVGHAAGATDTAAQWKNGVRMNLTSDNGPTNIAYAVAVSGTDIYAVGVHNNLPVYWKNGVMNTLNLSGSPDQAGGFATAIAVVGTDVYIAGATNSPASGYQATYWKNGVSTVLSANTSDVSNANGIAVAGSDIYVVGIVTSAGTNSYGPVYWKNGAEYKLSGTGSINAICVGN
jgi:hypothetical protein